MSDWKKLTLSDSDKADLGGFLEQEAGRLNMTPVQINFALEDPPNSLLPKQYFAGENILLHEDIPRAHFLAFCNVLGHPVETPNDLRELIEEARTGPGLRKKPKGVYGLSAQDAKIVGAYLQTVAKHNKQTIRDLNILMGDPAGSKLPKSYFKGEQIFLDIPEAREHFLKFCGVLGYTIEEPAHLDALVEWARSQMEQAEVPDNPTSRVQNPPTIKPSVPKTGIGGGS